MRKVRRRSTKTKRGIALLILMVEEKDQGSSNMGSLQGLGRQRNGCYSSTSRKSAALLTS
jgi:hypothetical protein